MLMCSRCHKRMAVVFITKLENGEKKDEGVCMTCAKELGLPLDNMLGDMMNKLGISSDELAGMEDEVAKMMENGGDLPAMMDDSDLDDDEARAPAIDLQKLFGGKQTPAPNVEGAKAGEEKQKEKKRKFLDSYCKDLNREAREGKLDSIVGREKELARVIQILSRRQKNNPCLIGEPGVGKTAIAEALAQKIVRGDVPYKLRNKELHLLDLTALVAGTQFRGQYESRLLGLLKEVKDDGNIILVIDEVHNIVGAGNSEGSVSTANMLKPALSRGEIQVIGATTLNEYRKYIEKDSALERRFQPVKVEEPSIEETLEMLKGIKHYYESFHQIKIPDGILKSAVVLFYLQCGREGKDMHAALVRLGASADDIALAFQCLDGDGQGTNRHPQHCCQDGHGVVLALGGANRLDDMHLPHGEIAHLLLQRALLNAQQIVEQVHQHLVDHRLVLIHGCPRLFELQKT